MIIHNYEVDKLSISDTSYVMTSILFPPCDVGFTEINGECYYQSDLDVIQIFIDNSTETINMDMDNDENGIIEPLELGEQGWNNGRISSLDCCWDYPITCNLVGEIPETIETLNELTILNLMYNQLSGEIPDAIGSLINLSYLSLGSNPLTGNIPDSIWGLINLSQFNLFNNQLSGEISDDIGNLTNLYCLYLSGNQFHGDIPSTIGNLTQLRTLYLYDNQFTGEIPSEMGNLSTLSILYLRNNQFTGEIPESVCQIYPNLTSFYIADNNLCPPYPECLSEEDIGEQDTSGCIDCPEVTGDTNDDDQVDIRDIILIVNLILLNEYDYCFDLNDDGELNILDLKIMIDIILFYY